MLGETETDLKENAKKEEWSKPCSLAHVQTVNTHSKLLWYKWLVPLHHFNPNIPHTCIKCYRQKGSLLHCMRECPQRILFRNRVLNLISLIIGKQVPLNPTLCILNVYPDNFVTSHNVRLPAYILPEAKGCIAFSWRKQTTCGISQWLRAMTFYLFRK